ncbi:MAG: cation:proton antiporter [Halobacteriota archaeon]|nr:cation:proton antiporter [Halobacteriota archaeon]
MEIGTVLLKLLVIIVAAKVGGEIAKRLKQPEVLGELMVGIFIGYTAMMSPDEPIITVLAELGIILFLFHVGLDSNINELMRMGRVSLSVACIGVVVPFALGYLTALLLWGDSMIAIFIGATLTATSITIPAMVLTDLGKLTSDESRVIIGAAVIDDVIGLIVLTILVPFLHSETVSFYSVTMTIVTAILFLVGSLLIGRKVTPSVIRVLGKGQSSGITVVAAFAFTLFLAYLADFFGLATVVGGFFAGLILAQTKNRDDIYEQTAPLTELFTPVFFVMMGTVIGAETLDANVIQVALLITAVAILGKLSSGLGAIGTKLNKFAIGSGMISRGEIALIFTGFGLSAGVINTELYSSMVIMVILTTIVTPMLLRITMEGTDPCNCEPGGSE